MSTARSFTSEHGLGFVMEVLMDDPRLILEFSDATPGTTVCRMDGELDMAAAEMVREALIGALDHHQIVAVDMRDLRFCDSCGFRALHQAQCAARERSARLVFVSASEAVLRVVRMIRFDHLEFTDDRSLVDPADRAATHPR